MKYLDLTLPTPAENLACDEALLDWREEGGGAEILRVWEPQQYFLVLGYANKASQEINLEVSRERGIPILRRCSGGGTVLQGPGCLSYSLILKIDEGNAFHSISETNCSIMERNAAVLTSLLGKAVTVQGFTDLAVNNLKCSGNAQRRKRAWILFHGTFLLDLKPGLMEELLLLPAKQPDYRQNRSHTEFLTQLRVPIYLVKEALQKFWGSTEPLLKIPRARIEDLVRDKYSQAAWNLKW